MKLLRHHVLALAGALLVAVSLSGCAAGSPAGTPKPTKVAAGPNVVKPGQEWILYQGPQDCGVSGLDPSSVCLQRPDGSGRHKLLNQDGELLHPDWSPDGNEAVFTASGGQEIWTAHVDGTHAKKIAQCSQFDGCSGVDFPAWSPDGKTIAFTVYDGGNLPLGPPAESEIALFNLASGKAQMVGQTSRGDVLDQPRWSHDGTRLTVQIDRFDTAGNEVGTAIAVVNASGGAAAPITDFAKFSSYPDWNPKSDQIVFNAGDLNPAGGPVDLYVVNVDGSGLTKISYPASEFQTSKQPSWTPDGKQIIFVQWGSRTPTLISPDGTGKTSDAGPVSHPRLRPLSGS